jgi:hypothetical protein
MPVSFSSRDLIQLPAHGHVLSSCVRLSSASNLGQITTGARSGAARANVVQNFGINLVGGGNVVRETSLFWNLEVDPNPRRMVFTIDSSTMDQAYFKPLIAATATARNVGYLCHYHETISFLTGCGSSAGLGEMVIPISGSLSLYAFAGSEFLLPACRGEFVWSEEYFCQQMSPPALRLDVRGEPERGLTEPKEPNEFRALISNSGINLPPMLIAALHRQLDVVLPDDEDDPTAEKIEPSIVSFRELVNFYVTHQVAIATLLGLNSNGIFLASWEPNSAARLTIYFLDSVSVRVIAVDTGRRKPLTMAWTGPKEDVLDDLVRLGIIDWITLHAGRAVTR